ncbi:hypothetical protein EJB05_00660, partial [Eragrostis curvula]
MSSTTAAASGALAGAWFGELASALQERWQAVCEHLPRQQPKLGSGGGLVENNNKKAAGAAAGAGNRTATRKDEEYVGACGGAISDATLPAARPVHAQLIPRHRVGRGGVPVDCSLPVSSSDHGLVPLPCQSATTLDDKQQAPTMFHNPAART